MNYELKIMNCAKRNHFVISSVARNLLTRQTAD